MFRCRVRLMNRALSQVYLHFITLEFGIWAGGSGVSVGRVCSVLTIPLKREIGGLRLILDDRAPLKAHLHIAVWVYFRRIIILTYLKVRVKNFFECKYFLKYYHTKYFTTYL